MAEHYNSFHKDSDNSYTKPGKTVEKMSKQLMQDLYDRLDQEILQRAGYENIAQFAPSEQADAATWRTHSDNPEFADEDDFVKVRVRHFNKAMKTRPYISAGGQGGTYKANEEEWYQQADKDKIETLIYDLKQGKTVDPSGSTGCTNTCTGTCKISCGGTEAS